MIACRNHASARATWQCCRCSACLCDSCVEVKQYGATRVELCPECREPCEPLAAADPLVERSAPSSLLSAFAYPLSGEGLLTIVGGAVVITLLGWLGGLIGSAIGAAVLLGYMLVIVNQTAEGADGLPDWPDFSLSPLFLGVVTGVVAFGPAFAALAGTGSLPLFWTLLAVGALYAPMGWVAVSLYDSALALDPVKVLRGILGAGPAYLFACALLFATMLVGQALLVGTTLLGPWLGDLVGTGVLLYLAIVEMRILGLVYRRRAHEIGWFSA